MNKNIKEAASIMGQKGGKITAKKGPKHWQKLQKMGVEARKKNNKKAKI